MENQITSKFDNFELHISQDIVNLLKESAKWANFLAILGFVGIGLMVIMGFFVSIMLGSMSDQLGGNPYSEFGIGSSMIGIIYIIAALLYFFPVWYMFKYAKKMKAALYSKDNAELTEAFKNLKSLFKYMGIMAIVVISLYVLIFIFAGIAGALA